LREVDIKKYIKVEKVPGSQLEDSKVLKGVMFNKDVVAPGKMKRKIPNPRIILLDCPVEYKKGENQTNAELVREEDWEVLLKMEEEYIENMCVQILKFKPDLVITEKGLSDLACHYLSKAGVSAIRRLRKTDNNRIAKACGATIVNRPDELQESDVGTGAGLFEVKKIGDEFFAFIVDCKDPKACTVLLRGASKDLLNEVERNLQVLNGLTVKLLSVFFFFLNIPQPSDVLNLVLNIGCHGCSKKYTQESKTPSWWGCYRINCICCSEAKKFIHRRHRKGE
jgi:T-complex protein 1 subunit gamma